MDTAIDAVVAATMTVDDFLVWTAGLDEEVDGRFELYNGKVAPVAPQLFEHVEMKGLVHRRLTEAIERAGVDCRVLVDAARRARVGAGDVHSGRDRAVRPATGKRARDR